MADSPPHGDASLSAARLMLAMHGVRIGRELLAAEVRRLGRRDLPTLGRLLQGHGLCVAWSTAHDWGRLAKQPLPALVETADGRILLLAKMTKDEVLLHDPAQRRPITMTREAFMAEWSGRLVAATPGRAAAVPRRAFGFAWFLPLLAKHRSVLTQAVVASLVLQIFALALPLSMMLVMDKVVVNAGLSTLNVMVVALLAITLFEFLLTALRSLLVSYATHRLDVELSAHLFRHLLALPMAYFDSRSTGATSARAKELDTIRAFATGPALTSAVDIVFTVVQLAVIWAMAPTFLVAVLAAMAVMIGLHAGVTPILRRRLTDKLRGDANGQAFLVEAIGGIETIKAAAIEGQMQRQWEEQVGERAEAAFRADQLSHTINAAIMLTGRLLTIGTLWWGVNLVVAGEMSLGQLVAFNMMAGRVLAPVQRLAQLWQQFQQARLAVKRVAEIIDGRPEPNQPAASLPPAEGRIEFRDVTFRYAPERQPVLRKIRCTIAPGEMVGVVGTSGSGKSTLMRLIQRLYVPESGRVLVDGLDIAAVDPGWLRRRVALVPQDTFLFDRSVRDNIALADPDLSHEQVAAAAELAGAHEFILALPDGYDTPVGERGHLLSGGQRQRLALARALASDPRILILDEATSALDSETERLIQRNMRRIAAGRTVIMVAHRLSTLCDADRILVLEHGEIVEEGRPAELLARGGRYAQLWRYQTPAEGGHVVSA